MKPQNKYATQAKAHLYAKRLAAIPKMKDIEEFGPHILQLMYGCPFSVWQMLDERPGLFGYMNDRFYMLRQVRNHSDWGSKLFKGLGRKDT